MMESSSSSSMMIVGPIPTLLYLLCSFIANAGVAVTGFGMGLIFILVYTIGEVAGGMKDCSVEALCDIKYAVFLQSLSLAGSMPLLIHQSHAFPCRGGPNNNNPALLQTLIPVTLIMTPLGQWCQTKLSATWIRLVVGGVVTLVVLYKLGVNNNNNNKMMMMGVDESKKKQHFSMTTTEETTIIPTTCHHHDHNHDDDVDETPLGTEQTPLLVQPFTSVHLAFDPHHGGGSDDDDDDDSSSNPNRAGVPLPPPLLPPRHSGGSNHNLHGFSLKAIRLWGVVLGGGSGFLGGLIGMRGPPLMIFFLMFPFPKAEARAVGAIMLCLNMILRVTYYIVSDVLQAAAAAAAAATDDSGGGESDDTNTSTTQPTHWFYRSEWCLYVGVVVAGMVGVPLGNWVHHRLEQHHFQCVLAILLGTTGVVNIWKAASELRLAENNAKQPMTS